MGRCCWWFTGEGVELMVGKESFICIDCKGQKSWYAIRCHTCNKKLYTKLKHTDEFRERIKKKILEIQEEEKLNWR